MKIYIKSKAFSEHMGVVKAQIHEGINQMSRIDLELCSRFSMKPDAVDESIGTPLTVVVEDIIDNAFHAVRFDGIICEMTDISRAIEDNGVYYFTAVVRPALWMLNYAVNSRSYPNARRIDVIDDLLESHGFTDSETYQKTYFKEDVYPEFYQIMQSGNSDLSFFKSILRQAGINYYFTCDPDGTKPEILHLTDNAALFPTFSGEVPIVNGGGMVQKNRRIEAIARHRRAVPNEVKATVYVVEGSGDPKSKSMPIEQSGSEGVVELFSPEGLTAPEGPAKQKSTALAEGFDAQRIFYTGSGDHLYLRPAKRISLKDYQTAETYQILVVQTHHLFYQSVPAALSEEGSGDPAYRNHFVAAEPMAPIRPTDRWTDVDIPMVSARSHRLNLNDDLAAAPRYQYTPRIEFNLKAHPKENSAAITEMLDTIGVLQTQIRELSSMYDTLKHTLPSGGGGLIAAEITEDAFVSDNKELCCKVKSELFETPITVKVSVMWYTTAGGTQFLPRKGNHVYIQRVAGGNENDWVVVAFRPSATVVSTNDPANETKITVFK